MAPPSHTPPAWGHPPHVSSELGGGEWGRLSGMPLASFATNLGGHRGSELGMGGGVALGQHSHHQQVERCREQGKAGEGACGEEEGWDGAEGNSDMLGLQELSAYEGIIRNIVD